jgi:hypothetical protein
VKLDARFLRIPLKDKGQALPRVANRPTAKIETERMINDRNSVLIGPDVSINRNSKKDNGVYAYLKE